MSNQQLFLSIGIPSLLILIGWLQTNVRLSDLKAEVATTKSDLKLEIATTKTDLSKRIEEIRSDLGGRIARLELDYREFYGMEKKLEGRVDELSRK
jgi:hypothetical protein